LESLLNAAFPNQKVESTWTGPLAVRIQQLPAAQRNQIAVAAARDLTNGDMITARVELLRDMESLRPITDPGVIAPLINMLDYPGVSTVVRGFAAQVLCRLTGREYTESYQYSTGEKHAQFVRWWRDWWAKNQDKHPVFEDDLKKAIVARVTAIRNQIYLEVKGYGVFASEYVVAVSVNRPDRDSVMAVGMDSSV
jgi:hypothetical protein